MGDVINKVLSYERRANFIEEVSGFIEEVIEFIDEILRCIDEEPILSAK
ncbi:hypothetical protein ACMGD3_10730 [Lysinibacillus sphaericus]